MVLLARYNDIREQPCPVVGGGEGAARFVRFVWRNAR